MPIDAVLKDLLTSSNLPLNSGIIHHGGKSYFAKSSSQIPQMRGEAASLVAMARTAPPGLIPLLVGYKEDQGGVAMVTRYANGGRPDMSSLGAALAAMHSVPRDQDGHDSQVDTTYTGLYGFPVPTHCGVTEQDNSWEESWLVFFRDRRLGDVVGRIGDKRVASTWDRLKDKAVPLLLSDFHPPAVPVPLHGDLWPGNLASDDGQAVIFDPAGYYGHAEDDLGMTHMFGGFTREFYEAYHATNPPSQPHHDQRIRLYELYHHLNHALMFGGSYVASSLRIMAELADWADTI